MTEDPFSMTIFRVFVPSLIYCLANENVKAVAGSEMYRLDTISPCQAEKLIRPRPDCVCLTVRICLLVVNTYTRTIATTESANSPTTRLGLPLVIVR